MLGRQLRSGTTIQESAATDLPEMAQSYSGDKTVALRGHTFQNAREVIEYLKSVSNAKERYSAQEEALTVMSSVHNRVESLIEEVFDYVERDKAYLTALTVDDFNSSWEDVRVIAESSRARRDRRDEAERATAIAWGSEVAAWFQKQSQSATFMANVRTLALLCDFEGGRAAINRAAVNRLSVRRRGISSQSNLQSADIVRAKALLGCEPVSTGELRQCGMRIGEHGFVEEGEAADEVEQGESGGRADFPGRAQEIAGTASESPSGSVYNFKPQDNDSADEDLFNTIGEELQEAGKELEDLGQSDEEGGRRKRRRVEGALCRCSPDVSFGWKSAVASSKTYGLPADLRLLRSMHGFSGVCYSHAKAMGGHMGLRVKQLQMPLLLERLRYLHEHCNEIGAVKTALDTFKWFRAKNRPARPSDDLGPYKFAHLEEDSASFDYDIKAVLEWVGMDDLDGWHRDGSVNFDVFGWWVDTPIWEIVLREIDMYKHHQREINGKANYGWLRNCFYSIGQQLMRQDPVYYAAYAALRPDKQWRLVSYPYYIKAQDVGDETYFRHIDLNVPDLLANQRGCNMIQGSVSLDDEDEENCTVILAGMQHKLGGWWERIVQRKQQTNGFVHRITERMFTREDAEVLGVDWKRVPCKKGEVRITLPHLPHGADGPATKPRRTMLPWLVGVQEDLQTLEVVEAGSVSMLAKAHRDMTAPLGTPSGLANRYGAIPYRFPAAVEVMGLGALSDALLCRRPWDSPAVLRERDTVLRGGRDAASEFVQRWRAKAVEAAVEADMIMQEAEIRCFGEKAYHYHWRRLKESGIPIPDLPPDEEEVADDGYEVGGNGSEPAFAEEGMEQQ
jgi:hypothetical protein